MDVSATELKVFMAIVKESSITGAALSLGSNQPNVTRSLQKLEKNLGTQLFVRSKKGVVLTRSGQRLLHASQKLMSAFDDLTDGLRQEADSLTGVYKIGVHSDLASHTVPKFGPGLIRDNPKLELHFKHGLSRTITEEVVNFKLDFGIVVNPARYPDLTICPLYRDEIGFWTAKRSPWSCGRETALRAEGVPIISNPLLSQTATLLNKVNRQGYFPAHRVIHTTSLALISDMVAGAAGVGILPRTIAQLSHGSVVEPVAGLPTHSDNICLIYRKDILRGTAGHLIKDAITQAF